MSQRIGLRSLTGVRSWLVTGLVASAIALGSCASTGAGGSSAATKWPTRADVAPSAAFTADGLAALDAKMKEAVDKGQVAGLEYILIKDDKVVAFNIFGAQSLGGSPMTEDTIFRIRSMTKPITGVAMMQLWEKGLWKPEDPVTKFLPELGSLKVAAGGNGIATAVPASRPPNMNEIMTHTAGFGYGLNESTEVDREFIKNNPHAQPNLPAAMKRLAEIPLLAQPGERWSYSYAVDVQAAALEKMTGMTFGDYLDKNVFGPLGMKDTGFFVPEADEARFATVYTRNAQTGAYDLYPDAYSFFIRNHHESGGGGAVSTTHDYARFVQMILNEGSLDGKQILKPETVKVMMSNHIGDMRGVFTGGGFGWGGAVSKGPTERSALPAGTFSWFGIDGTWFWADPVNKLGFVGMIQRRGNGGPGAVNFQGDSASLVYKALKPAS